MEVDNANKRRKQTAKRTKACHQWTKEEDATLVECLRVLVEDQKWRADDGTFRRRQYNAIVERLALESGFGWDDVEKCLTASKDVFDDWVRSHRNAKGLRNKAFPNYDDYVAIFGSDRATRLGAEIVADAVEKIGDSADDDSAEVEKETKTPAIGTIDDVDGSTGATGASSRRTEAHKRERSSDGTDELVEQLAGIKNIYQDSMQEMMTFFRKE
ncbi:hypothetical protein PTKIN_Ptkin03bG0163400 [Pterospermum kingtungense]